MEAAAIQVATNVARMLLHNLSREGEIEQLEALSRLHGRLFADPDFLDGISWTAIASRRVPSWYVPELGGVTSMKRFVLVLAAFATLSMTSARAGTFTVASDLQGWVRSTGEGNGAVDGNNTFTGNEFSGRFNSWSNFNLSGVSGTVTSAVLDITLERFPFGDTGAYTIGINDVSTPLSAFVSSSSGVAGYTDLGSGNQYGTATGANDEIFVTLSSQALADINAALGAGFILGYTNLTLNGVPSGPGDDIGSYTNNLESGHPVLILTTGAVVPEPTSVVLLGIGFAGLIGGYRLRKSKLLA
jgi:hypothetical protein